MGVLIDTTNEVLQVKPVAEDDAGNPLEPEQRPAQHSMGFLPSIRMTTGEEVKGQFQNENRIEIEKTAGTFAMEFRHRCRHCKHWDHKGFQDLWAKIKDSQEPEAFRVKSFLMGVFQENGFNGQEFGICQAQSALFQETIPYHYEGGCPIGSAGPDGSVLADMFQPRDNASEEAGARSYDAVLSAAEGQNTSLRKLKRKLILKF
jgi:hypothetical protein